MTDALTVLREIRTWIVDVRPEPAAVLRRIREEIARLEREQAEEKLGGRPESVQRIMAYLKRQADYRDGVPKDWMRADHGDESAMIRYVEELEKR